MSEHAIDSGGWCRTCDCSAYVCQREEVRRLERDLTEARKALEIEQAAHSNAESECLALYAKLKQVESAEKSLSEANEKAERELAAERGLRLGTVEVVKQLEKSLTEARKERDERADAAETMRDLAEKYLLEAAEERGRREQADSITQDVLNKWKAAEKSLSEARERIKFLEANVREHLEDCPLGGPEFTGPNP